ncbi:MAG UNVERIFIED_CONTAM: helix-turn-helix transcriptional regulator [Rickettsiaceae bacterium]|jgi:hypothetical protein
MKPNYNGFIIKYGVKLMLRDQNNFGNYYSNLKTIHNVEFTNREIDIISCILNGRTSYKEIAILLSISPRTVEANKSNINRKIHLAENYNIRDFLERSDKYFLIKTHYINLINKHAFELLIKKIVPVIKKQKPLSIEIYHPTNENIDIGIFNQNELISLLESLGFVIYYKTYSRYFATIKVMFRNCYRLYIIYSLKRFLRGSK